MSNKKLDAIKARHEIANSQPITDLRVWDSVSDVPALVAAVEAVLELHKPITDDGNSLRNWLGMYDGKPRDYCNECEVDGYTAVPYPCPTVTAIQSELGEEDE